MTSDQLAVFVNPAARKGRAAAAARAVLTRLDELAPLHGFAHPQLIEASSAAEVRERAAVLAGRGVARVIVIGGDGLVHQVIQGIAGTATSLGVIPLGSGNDFAAALGLPTDPMAAAEVAMGPHRPLDLLRSSRGWAASVATVGFSAAVNERAERLRWPKGGARYTVATLLQLPLLRPVDLVMHLGGTTSSRSRFGSPAEEEHRVRAALVAVGNTALFGGGMRICPNARPDDGVLDVTVIDAVGRLDLLRHFARVFRGTHVRHPAVSTYRARSVTLVAPGLADGVARADGEAWGRLPLTIDAVPNALRIAAPALAPAPGSAASAAGDAPGEQSWSAGRWGRLRSRRRAPGSARRSSSSDPQPPLPPAAG